MSELSLSHIAIAVPEIEQALSRLKALGLASKERMEVPTEKVKVAMVPVGMSSHFRIEFLEPTDTSSPISKYLEKKPGGGLHHLCFEVKGLDAWEKKVRAAGLEVLPPGIRKAARGRAFFIHPKSMNGVLVELEEIS